MKASLRLSLFALTAVLSDALPNGVPLVVSPGINVSTSPASKKPDCNDFASGISPACYGTLNINAYLKNYNTTIRPETCGPTETWSSCYQLHVYANASASSPTRQTITQHHDCTNLTTSTSNSDKCTQPYANQKQWTVDDFYGAFNIYSLQHHISIWAQAISAASSQPAIKTITASDTPADSEAQSATSVLATLILKYTVDRQADQGLVRLLEAQPNATKVPKRPQSSPQRVPSTIEEPSPAAWQPVLQARLAEVLALAMDDFDFFLETVREGGFSTTGLAVVGQLTEAMKKNPS